MKELRHLCGHSQPDFGEWSMSQKGSLMLRKKYRGKPAQKIAKYWWFLGTYMAQLTCFEWELSHLSPAFCIWHRWRNSRFWAIYFDIKIPNLVRRPRDLNISATPETCILVHEILHQGGSNHVLILQVQNASSSLALPSIRSNDGFVG